VIDKQDSGSRIIWSLLSIKRHWKYEAKKHFESHGKYLSVKAAWETVVVTWSCRHPEARASMRFSTFRLLQKNEKVSRHRLILLYE
jgi:hypothetical protein